jgi:hypothetical protein
VIEAVAESLVSFFGQALCVTDVTVGADTMVVCLLGLDGAHTSHDV